jgi:hypothetical protein
MAIFPLLRLYRIVAAPTHTRKHFTVLQYISTSQSHASIKEKTVKRREGNGKYISAKAKPSKWPAFMIGAKEHNSDLIYHHLRGHKRQFCEESVWQNPNA